jgi:hypothetical protein
MRYTRNQRINQLGRSRSGGSSSVLSMRLGVAPGGRYLANNGGSGAPTFLRCFSAWPIALSNPARWSDYIASVKARGFNALKMQVLTKWGTTAHNASTYDGISPFTGANFSTPRETYFARVDSFLDLLAQENLYSVLAPLYYGYRPGGSAQGWKPEADTAGVSVIQDYGAFVGARYANRANVVWLLAGDHTPDHVGTAESNPQLLKGMLDGLRGAGATQLACPHFGQDDTSALITPAGHTWDLYTWYTWTKDGCSEYALDAYAANVGPVFEAEVLYENNGGFITNTRELRAQWWRALLGGSLAAVDYGNEGWGYPDSGGTEPFPQGGDWEDFVNDSGAAWYQIMADKVTAEAWHLLVPEAEGASTLVTSGGGTLGTAGYVSRCKASDSSVAFFYVYDGHSFDVARSQMSGTFAATWIDPTNGSESAVSGSPLTNSGTLTLNAGSAKGNNAAGQADWAVRLKVQ